MQKLGVQALDSQSVSSEGRWSWSYLQRCVFPRSNVGVKECECL